MYDRVKNVLSIALCFVVLAGATAGAQTTTALVPPQHSDQIAIQLGAIQLGITNLGSATAQQRASALAQGRLALGVTSVTYDTTAFVSGATTPPPRSQAFRDQLQQAAIAALQSPLNLSVNGRVSLSNGRSILVAGVLNPTRTTASLIFDFAVQRLPNIAPGLVMNAIASAGNFRAPANASADANLIAENAMVKTLRNYAGGTRQWGRISTTAPSLPNFGTNTVNGVVPNVNGLMDAAAAVAANSIRALDSDDPDKVAAMTAALIRGADNFRRISATVVDGNVPRFGGAVSATTTGLVAQFSGNQQNDWNNALTGDLLDAVVAGAMSGSKTQFVAIGYGAAAGFAGTYVATSGSLAAFNVNAVAADILASFRSLGLVPQRKLPALNAAILAGLRVGLDESSWTDAVNGIAGIGGIKEFTVINGSGTPLTDTVGL